MAEPSSVFALEERRSSNSSSSSRPISAVRPLACRASKRLSTDAGRKATPARGWVAYALQVLRANLVAQRDFRGAFPVLSAITTVFGSATPRRRAARFGSSPTMPRSCASPKVADYHQPRNNAYARFQWSTGVQTARRLDHAQRRMCAQRKGHRGDAASVLLYAIGGWWALE